MKLLDENLWIADAPLRFVGLEVGARMTVVRLPDGRLWLHSPVAAAPEIVGAVRELGSVAYLVAPNKLHHLFVQDWQREFPDASLHVAPGLETKRPELEVAGLLSSEPDPGWSGSIDQVFFEGFPFANEVVFFHRPSATLIATDLAFNLGPESSALTRFVFKMGGAGPMAPTYLERMLVRDRPAFRRAFEHMLEWPFERIVVAHGEVAEKGGREDLLRGYGWLLDD